MADVIYLAQIKTPAGIWVNLGISSPSLEEVNKAVVQYQFKFGSVEIRVIQRPVKIPIFNKVPGCC